MLLPTKHTRLSESIIGFAAYLLERIGNDCLIDNLWAAYQHDFSQGRYRTRHSFDSFLLALAFLYAIGVIEETEGGLVRCS